ncbi:MAG TPA: hypothetical protein VJM31_16355 [Vicinamibacterales bacterium]|nr:hypothetical protein [Vicinamibacterales bacterium]
MTLLTPRNTLAASLFLFATSVHTPGQTVACGELAVNIMIRASQRSASAAATANRAFDRLASLTDDALTGADKLFSLADDLSAETAMREFLQLRTGPEAEVILAFANRTPQSAQIGLLRASKMAAVAGVEPGKSVQLLLSSGRLVDAAKTATLRDIGELSDLGLSGTPTLLKRAAEQVDEPNFGDLFEIQASAAIARNGSYGSFVDVAVDRAGPPGITGVDTLTSTHAFQIKSKVSAGQVMTLDDVPTSKLQELLRDRNGRVPVLVHSNPIDEPLLAACIERGIQTLQVELVR